MSWRACKRVWDEYRGPPVTKFVLLALADYGDDTGESIHPAIAALARKVGMSKRHTQRIVGDLVRAGVIECTRNQDGGAPGATRHYRIRFDLLTGDADVIPTGDGSVIRDAPETGDTGVQGRVTSTTQTGDTQGRRRVTRMSPKPKGNRKEPTIEPRERAIPSPLPLSFEPSSADREWLEGEIQARNLEHTIGDVAGWHRTAVQKFVLHFDGKRRTNWPKEYRLWMLRELEFAQQRKQGNGKAAPRRRTIDIGDPDRKPDYGETGEIT